MNSQPELPPPSRRNHGLDLLRYVLMVAGILLHTLCAYLSSYKIPEFPLYDGATTTPWADGIVVLIHTFRMPLFFMISGYFSANSLRKSDASGYLSKRFKRIFIPLLVSMGTLLPLFRWTLSDFHWPFMNFDFQLSYLWFLADLWWINLFVYTFRKAFLRVMKALAADYWSWLLIFILVVTTATIYSSADGLLKTADHWLPDPTLLFFYFCFFSLGVGFFLKGQQDPQPPRTAQRWWAWGILVFSALGYLFCVQKIFQGQEDFLLLASALHGLLSLGLSLIFFFTFFPLEIKETKLISYLAKSSYTSYLVHPIFLALAVPQVAAINKTLPFANPLIVFIIGSALSLGTYHICVRKTRLQEYL